MQLGKGDDGIGKAEQKPVLDEWNQTDKAFEDTLCIHQLFEQQAQFRPEATALVFRDQSISYIELNTQADKLAAHLQSLGAKPDALVGIFIERSIDMLIGLLAILKSGAAYVPLDPNYPRDRIALMVADSEATILLTHSSLLDRLPIDNATDACDIKTVCIDDGSNDAEKEIEKSVSPQHLAYVIYTSGSTGLPKGVMVEHRNVINFMAGMDDTLNYSGRPGVWLAVTSISFDISVLELFWSLTRGFKVVIQEEKTLTFDSGASQQEESSQSTSAQTVSLVDRKMDVGLFYFSSDAGPNTSGDRYQLLLEGAKFSDKHDFSTVWTPERHFHLFGGLYPNPSVTSAAVAAVTNNIAIRAGSIVLPLHNPIRVAEEWSVVDNLSNGRVGFSFASGWHVNDFALKPENFENRRQLMFDEIETVRKLWRGESIEVLNGEGQPFEAKIYPPAIQSEPPIWITTAGNIDTFRAAGEGGFNVLTNLLGQSIEELTNKIAAYRQGRKDKGFQGQGNVSVMVHTFIGSDIDNVREIVREPFSHYLKTSFDLVKMAPWAFPAFKQPSKSAAQDNSFDAETLTDEDMDALIEHAFDRYFETAGLFGTAQSVLPLMDQIKSAGIDEVACLIDFGVDDSTVLDNLKHLNQLRINCNPESYVDTSSEIEGLKVEDYSLAAQIKKHGVTHFQCTPSMARIITADDDSLSAMCDLKTVLLGGEALPVDLARKIDSQISGELINVYGPTETTIWSTSAVVNIDDSDNKISIGRPIANTKTYIVDDDLQATAVGVAGELMIGGRGVVRGYHRRPDLTAEKFIANPFFDRDDKNNNKADVIYRTGDLAVYRDDGEIEFLGRLDHQVKLRGYRIELGEIESILNSCDGVKDSVVIATNDSDSEQSSESEEVQKLLAYIVAGEASDKQSNTYWQTIWDQAYINDNKNEKTKDIRSAAITDPTFNTSGWIDSYTGESHLTAHMQEWVDTTVNRIMQLKPRRVLEIGCGTGLLLYRVAPQCEHYVGVDFSSSALALIDQQVKRLGLNNVSLIENSADDLSLEGLAPFDLVIINSVIQYFPSADYLINVLRSAAQQLTPDGQLFIGDVRNLSLKNLFNTSIEIAKAPDDLTVESLQQRIRSHDEQESELLISPDFFSQLSHTIPSIANVDIQLKRGQYCTEMSAYRYDVVLHLDSKAQPLKDEDFIQLDTPNNLLELQKMIGAASGPIVFRDLVNARLVENQLIRNLLETEKPTERVTDLHQLVATGQQCANGFHYANSFQPEDIYQLTSDYSIALRWAKSGDSACFDVYCYPADSNAYLTVPVLDSKKPLSEWCNHPIQSADDFELIDHVKARLEKSLPEFMVPNEFVVLEAIPLTPNGKVDRKALPKPEKRQRVTVSEFVAPESNIEKTIAIVFQEMLNIEKMGTNDDFFSLGANSLLIAQANNRLGQRFDRKVSLVAMYRYPTIALLAAYLSGNVDNKKSAETGEARAQQRKSAASRRRKKSIRL